MIKYEVVQGRKVGGEEGAGVKEKKERGRDLSYAQGAIEREERLGGESQLFPVHG